MKSVQVCPCFEVFVDSLQSEKETKITTKSTPLQKGHRKKMARVTPRGLPHKNTKNLQSQPLCRSTLFFDFVLSIDIIMVGQFDKPMSINKHLGFQIVNRQCGTIVFCQSTLGVDFNVF